MLRHQGQVLGPVASAPTVWRARDELTPAAVRRIETARARVRRHVWSQLHATSGLPASKVADTDLGDVVVLDVDATLVTAHSEKEAAAATFRGGFGYHPLGVCCDNTSEMLAAIKQVPPKHRHKLLVRADGAGASHGLLDWLTALNRKRARSMEYSVGFAVTGPVRDAIARVPTAAWQAAVDAHGEVREGGDVVELTGMLDLKKWPPGMRIIVRRERPHPDAELSLFEEADGWRYQAVATNTTTGQLAFLEARHRAHARVEDRIRHAKDCGLGQFPSLEFKINQAWTLLTTIAAGLIAWLYMLALPETLKTCEPKALRYRLLHVPARLIRSGRRRRLRIPQSWPWAKQIAATSERINKIPAPT